MKPHSLRRVLWFGNIALGAAAVGLVAWMALDVRPAVGAVVQRAANYQPPEYKALRADYEKMRLVGLAWTPEAPVSEDEFKGTILRPDYAKLVPQHWIFVGPMPPTEVAPSGPTELKPPAPAGLESMGKVTVVMGDPPTWSVLFEFGADKKSRAFGVGDFVRASEGDAPRFKLVGLKQPARSVYEILYEVYGDDPQKPERTASLVYDPLGQLPEFPFLRPAQPAAPGTAPGTAPGAGAGTAAPGSPGAGADAGAGEGTQAGVANPDERPRVIEASSKPDDQLTLEDLRPTVHVDPNNARNRVVEFDSNSYRYFRGRNATSIAETVKTDEAIEPGTGRRLGLRITGFQEGAPADVFDVRRGDILVSINGRPVTSRSEAINIAQKLPPDAIVTVVIDRNGRNITYRVDPQDPHTKRKIRYFENLR